MTRSSLRKSLRIGIFPLPFFLLVTSQVSDSEASSFDLDFELQEDITFMRKLSDCL